MDDYSTCQSSADPNEFRTTNPSTGLTMVGFGVDVGGNPYGGVTNDLFTTFPKEAGHGRNNGWFVLGAGTILLLSMLFI